MLLDELRESGPRLSVGILTSDMMQLGSEIALLEEAGIKLLHFDVMDGGLWPKITVGPSFVQGLKTSMLKDVHLLIDKPENHIESFVKAGADMINFAVESCSGIGGALEKMGRMKNANDPDRGILRGLSLNPATPVDTIAPFVAEIDSVLLLAVGPDTGGQNFLANLPERIAKVKTLKEDILINIDGAVKKDTIADIAAMTPDIIVTGSAVFDGRDARGNLNVMMEASKHA